MRRVWTPLALLLAACAEVTTPPAAAPPASPVAVLYDRYLGAAAGLDPTWATGIGIHDFDDNLTHYDDLSHQARRLLAERTLDELDTIDAAALTDPVERLDARLFRSSLELELFWDRLRDARTVEPSIPLGAISVIHTMLVKDYAPAPRRVENVIRRLRQIPGVCDEIRAKLQRPPRIWTEAAIDDVEGAVAFLDEVTAMAEPGIEGDDMRRARLTDALRDARRGYEDYLRFLRDDLLPRSDGSFVIGVGAYNFLLVTWHFLELDADQLIALGNDEVSRTRQHMIALAREIDPNRTPEEILDAILHDYPPPDQLLDAYRLEVDTAREFFRDYVDIPRDERLEVILTPAFERSSTPYAAYDMPPPLDSSRTGHFYVTPPDEGGDVAEFMTGHNVHDIPGTVVHEAYPGHHLQFLYAKDVPSKIRRILDEPTMSEGWGLYCEELAAETGYLRTPQARLMQLNWRLQRAARVVLDASLAIGRITYDDAVRYLMEQVHLTESQARGSVLGYTQEPGYFMSYLVGCLTIQRMRDAARERLGSRFTLREFHERILRYGNVPAALIAEELQRDWN